MKRTYVYYIDGLPYAIFQRQTPKEMLIARVQLHLAGISHKVRS